MTAKPKTEYEFLKDGVVIKTIPLCYEIYATKYAAKKGFAYRVKMTNTEIVVQPVKAYYLYADSMGTKVAARITGTIDKAVELAARLGLYFGEVGTDRRMVEV